PSTCWNSLNMNDDLERGGPFCLLSRREVAQAAIAQVASCEACNPEAAEFPFECILMPANSCFYQASVNNFHCLADSLCIARVQGITQHESVRGHLWEFPLTANYYFGQKRIRPYVGGGVVLGQAFGGKSSGDGAGRFTDLTTGNEISIPAGLGLQGPPVGH